MTVKMPSQVGGREGEGAGEKETEKFSGKRRRNGVIKAAAKSYKENARKRRYIARPADLNHPGGGGRPLNQFLCS